jgi:hypothetical protein
MILKTSPDTPIAKRIVRTRQCYINETRVAAVRCIGNGRNGRFESHRWVKRIDCRRGNLDEI